MALLVCTLQAQIRAFTLMRMHTVLRAMATCHVRLIGLLLCAAEKWKRRNPPGMATPFALIRLMTNDLGLGA